MAVIVNDQDQPNDAADIGVSLSAGMAASYF